MSAQAPQEARLTLLELGVGRSRAGDHVDDLRKRQRKDGQRHERQDQALGLEILVQAPGSLRVAEALGALDPRLAALLFGDGLPLAGAERFPLPQPDTVPALQDAPAG